MGKIEKIDGDGKASTPQLVWSKQRGIDGLSPSLHPFGYRKSRDNLEENVTIFDIKPEHYNIVTLGELVELYPKPDYKSDPELHRDREFTIIEPEIEKALELTS